MNPSTRKTILCAILLAAVMGAVFGRSLWYPFLIWDDPKHVTQNHRVNPPSVDGLKEIWRRPYFGLYIPLSYTFFAAESSIARQPLENGVGSRPNPAVFHAGCVMLHIGCVLLVFFLLRKLFKHDLAAMAGAMLFGLHPLQVESVAWISETRGLLCALFSLLAIYVYLPAEPSRENWKRYVLATLCFVAALLSKPAAVVVPVMVLLLVLLTEKREQRDQTLFSVFKRTLLFMAPWFAISLGFVVLTKLQQSVSGAPSIWARPLIAGDALAFYLNKLFAPVLLCSDYGRTPAVAMADWTFYVAWLLPVALVAAFACLPNRRILLIASALFAAWLLPVLGFVPFRYQHFSTVADRYVYLAMLGPALALCWFFSKPRPQIASTIASLVLFALAGASMYQVWQWRDDQSLLTYTLWQNPTSLTANSNYGFLLTEHGQYAEAIPYLETALETDPEFGGAHLNLGLALRSNPMASFADTRRARWHFERARQLMPDSPMVYYNLGVMALNEDGDEAAARACFEQAVSLDRYFARAHYNLGVVLRRQGHIEDARESFREALRLLPEGSEEAKQAQKQLNRL